MRNEGIFYVAVCPLPNSRTKLSGYIRRRKLPILRRVGTWALLTHSLPTDRRRTNRNNCCSGFPALVTAFAMQSIRDSQGLSDSEVTNIVSSAQGTVRLCSRTPDRTSSAHFWDGPICPGFVTAVDNNKDRVCPCNLRPKIAQILVHNNLPTRHRI